MPVPRKRELAAYMILYKHGVREYGEAIDILSKELCTSRKTARNIIKRLKRIGALSLEKRGEHIGVGLVDPESLLWLIASGYVSARRERCRDEEGRTHLASSRR